MSTDFFFRNEKIIMASIATGAAVISAISLYYYFNSMENKPK